MMLLAYLLKTIACSAAFYGLYMLLFRNEKMPVFNRFYLLASLVISFVIPLVTFTIYITYNVDYTVEGAVPPMKSSDGTNYVMIALTIILVTGSIILLARFIRNLAHLKRRANYSNGLLNFKGAKIILLPEPVVPHSFLNTIFLNRNEYHNQQIQYEVLEHELAHVKQKHSWDILFIEILQIFCWFNPVIYLYKRSIKMNHEILADAAVVKKLGDVRSYQAILLQRAVAQSTLELVSSFTFSTIKKRMIMLTKNTNPYQGWARSISVLPTVAILILLFAERSYAQKEYPKIRVHDEAIGKRTDKEREDIKSIKFSYSKDRKKTQIRMAYQDGRIIEETLSNSGDVDAFEKKYGIELPPPPPPEPPTRKKKVAAPSPPLKMGEPAPPLQSTMLAPANLTAAQAAVTSKRKSLIELTELAEKELTLMKSLQDQEIIKPMLNLYKNKQVAFFEPPAH